MADETTTAEVDQDVETPDLATMQNEWAQREIETMLGTANQADGEQGDTNSDEGADVQEDADEAEPNVDQRAPGIDTALKFLDDNNPDLAGVVRAQIRDNQSLRERQKSIEENLEDAVQNAVQVALQEQQTESAEDDGEYTPEQIEQAKKVLRSMGVVTKEDLAQEEQQKSLTQYLNGAVESGVQDFGDMFGRIEDGKPVISEGALERIKAENQRIQQYGTITAKDLFVLSHFDELVKAAEERGRKQSGAQTAQRQKKLNGAATALNTAPDAPRPNLRGNSKKEDSIRDVVMRSMNVARKNLGL